jgi:hypothetical protein
MFRSLTKFPSADVTVTPRAFEKVRFDPVYVGHFKCNFRTIRDGYPAIDLYVHSLRRVPPRVRRNDEDEDERAELTPNLSIFCQVVAKIVLGLGRF